MNGQRKGLELTMAINANGEQCPNQAWRSRQASQSLGGSSGERLEAAAHCLGIPVLGRRRAQVPGWGRTATAAARARAVRTAAVRVATSYAPWWRLPLMKKVGVPVTPLASAVLTSSATRPACS